MHIAQIIVYLVLSLVGNNIKCLYAHCKECMSEMETVVCYILVHSIYHSYQ